MSPNRWVLIARRKKTWQEDHRRHQEEESRRAAEQYRMREEELAIKREEVGSGTSDEQSAGTPDVKGATMTAEEHEVRKRTTAGILEMEQPIYLRGSFGESCSSERQQHQQERVRLVRDFATKTAYLNDEENLGLIKAFAASLKEPINDAEQRELTATFSLYLGSFNRKAVMHAFVTSLPVPEDYEAPLFELFKRHLRQLGLEELSEFGGYMAAVEILLIRMASESPALFTKECVSWDVDPNDMDRVLPIPRPFPLTLYNVYEYRLPLALNPWTAPPELEKASIDGIGSGDDEDSDDEYDRWVSERAQAEHDADSDNEEESLQEIKAPPAETNEACCDDQDSNDDSDHDSDGKPYGDPDGELDSDFDSEPDGGPDREPIGEPVGNPDDDFNGDSDGDSDDDDSDGYSSDEYPGYVPKYKEPLAEDGPPPGSDLEVYEQMRMFVRNRAFRVSRLGDLLQDMLDDEEDEYQESEQDSDDEGWRDPDEADSSNPTIPLWFRPCLTEDFRIDSVQQVLSQNPWQQSIEDAERLHTHFREVGDVYNRFLAYERRQLRFDPEWLSKLGETYEDTLLILDESFRESFYRPDLETIRSNLRLAEKYFVAKEHGVLSSNSHHFVAYASRYMRAMLRYKFKRVLAGLSTPEYKKANYTNCMLLRHEEELPYLAAFIPAGKMCSICHDEEENPVTVTTYECCRQPFHVDCLLEWLLTDLKPSRGLRQRCPYCRQRIDLEYLGEVLETKTSSLNVL